MTEFIINSDQLERLIEAVEHDTGREINRVVIDGVRASEIVRCRDCKHYNPELYNNISCEWFMFDIGSDGFCAWGVRRDSWTTCKCGEEIELGGREVAVCPSCGRTVRS